MNRERRGENHTDTLTHIINGSPCDLGKRHEQLKTRGRYSSRSNYFGLPSLRGGHLHRTAYSCRGGSFSHFGFEGRFVLRAHPWGTARRKRPEADTSQVLDEHNVEEGTHNDRERVESQDDTCTCSFAIDGGKRRDRNLRRERHACAHVQAKQAVSRIWR